MGITTDPLFDCLLLAKFDASLTGGVLTSWSEEVATLLGEFVRHSEGLFLETFVGWTGGDGEEVDDAG